MEIGEEWHTKLDSNRDTAKKEADCTTAISTRACIGQARRKMSERKDRN